RSLRRGVSKFPASERANRRVPPSNRQYQRRDRRDHRRTAGLTILLHFPLSRKVLRPAWPAASSCGVGRVFSSLGVLAGPVFKLYCRPVNQLEKWSCRRKLCVVIDVRASSGIIGRSTEGYASDAVSY